MGRNKGYKHSEETKRKLSKIMRGKHHPNSGFQKGHKCYSTKESIKKLSKNFSDEEIKEIINDYTLEKKNLGEIADKFDCSRQPISKVLKKNGVILRTAGDYWLGKKLSEKHRKNVHNGRINYENERKGIVMKDIAKMYVEDDKTCEQIAKKYGADIHTIIRRLDILGIKRKSSSERLKELWKNKKFRENRIKFVKPNKPEKIIINIIKQYNLNFIYVGNGKKWVRGENTLFNPDFIHKEKKLIIEHFGDYWHNLPNIKKRDKLRVKAYSNKGYKTLIIWENELKNKKQEIPNKIINFVQENENQKLFKSL